MGALDETGLAHIGRLPMASIRRAFDIDLDGEWDFQLRARADELGDAWAAVQVPSLWTMDPAYGIPHYSNVPMPFSEVPPAIPADNPVGVYRRTVTVAPRPDRRVILHVGAAEGHLRVHVNGTAIGTSSDSHLAAEFDITDALVAGDNVIELQVARWSAASYIEDQDQWWQSGISRSVGLFDVPDVRLSDVRIVADYDAETQRASLQAEALVEALAHLADTRHSVRFSVEGASHVVPVAGRFVQPSLPRGKGSRDERPEQRLPEDFMDLLSIRAADTAPPPEFRAMPNAFGQAPSGPASPAGTAHLALDDLDVAPWTAETPVLHDVLIELLDGAGAVVDSTRQRVGFRRVQIVGRDLLVNGRRILVQGVNRHDVDPRTGRVISAERVAAELSLLKRFNVNAIRTSHYPNDPLFLDLCDEYGFYVVDEADVEGHAFASTIADNRHYLTEIVERVQRMVLRDRNHPSIITWSLGNETGYGAAHDAAAAWVRSADPTRPVQYEGAISTDWHAGQRATDILCPMYPSFASLEGYAADPRANRPLITCEYAYSQGNGTGGLAEYWRLFETTPGLQGGFLWEFLDHALDRDGDGRYRYGGDFGDEPNDGVVMLNGIAFSDLTPKPAMWEMRGLFAPARIVAGEAGRVLVRNRQTFADLAGYAAEFAVETRAGSVAATAVELPGIGAGDEVWVTLPDSVAQAAARDDALAVTLRLATRDDRSWAPAGTEIAASQHVLAEKVVEAVRGIAPARVDEDGEVRHPLLASAPRLSLWRAMTDHDLSFALDNRFVRNGFFELDRVSAVVEEEADATVVELVYETAYGDRVTHRRRISTTATGGFAFEEHVTLPEGTRDGLRVGMEFAVASDLDAVEWVGLGPWENYPDRCTSALLGRWSERVAGMAVPYLRPQANGTRGGVTEASFAGSSGTITASSAHPLHLTVSEYSSEQLESADHWWELEPDGQVRVHLDIAHRGVGTALLGPDTRPAFRLAGTQYAWSWGLEFDAR
ncbi:glycoside hydrolase family 2 TIM barrel-domain containing protein [Microbacterium lacticum]